MIRSNIGLAVFTVSMSVLMYLSWGSFDRELVLWHEVQPNLFEDFWDTVTLLGDGVTPLVPSFLAWAALRLLNFRRGARIALFIFTATLAAALVTDVMKPIFGRARPTMLEDGVYGMQWFHISYALLSFPSGHATTAFASMSALARVFPAKRAWFILAAVIIAYSRVAIGKHYLTDVIMGAVVGVLVTEYVYRKLFDRLRPKEESAEPSGQAA